MNYFQVHKNKKPKAIKRKSKKYVSTLKIRTALISVMGAVQVKKIISQPQPDYFKGLGGHLGIMNKTLSVATQTMETYSAITKEIQKEKQIRFKKTGRYVK